MKALFYADGGPGVGLGHLRRSTAVAHGLIRKGWECRFIASVPESRAWLSRQGCLLAPSQTAAPGRLPDADYAADLFVLDSYLISNEDAAARVKGKAAVIAAFDDHQNRHDLADAVINTGLRAPSLDWPGRGHIEHLLGPAFHPLSREYLPLPSRRVLRPEVRRVMVTLGGAAQAEQMGKIVSLAVAVLPNADWDCVAGPFSAGSLDLGSIPGVLVHQGANSIKSLMLGCDLAVVGSGQTLFEVAATGTPAIAVGLAENQKENLAGMEEAGIVISAGFIGDGDFEVKLEKCLKKAADPEVRRKLSENGQRLIDGKGIERMEAVFVKLLTQKGAKL